MDVVKAINQGGSVLYTVNPVRVKTDDGSSGDLSLMTLAGESGGQYFAGSDIKEVTENLKGATSAYYELAFSLRQLTEDRMTVEVSCKRPGIHIHTINHTEQEKPYRLLEKVKRKLFALDVVNGGSWSRIVGKIVKVKIDRQTPVGKGDERSYRLNIRLPERMRDLKLDLFLLQFDDGGRKIDIRMVSKQLKDEVDFNVELNGKKRMFFVIVEPQKTYCIYNQII